MTASIFPLTENDRGLNMGGFPLDLIEFQFGTPTYLYSADAIRANAARVLDAFREHYTGAFAVHYALKGNSNPAILSLLRECGLHAECVSDGEWHAAKAAGFAGPQLILNGNAKGAEELRGAILEDEALVVVDGPDELDALGHLAEIENRIVRVLFRVRPDIRAGFHDHVTTAIHDAKFGMLPGTIRAIAARLGEYPHIAAMGLHVHLGSQIGGIAPYLEAAKMLLALGDELARSHAFHFSFLDLGGGMAIPEKEGDAPFDFAALATALESLLASRVARPQLILEPCRAITGNSGVLIGSVLSVKNEGGRRLIATNIGYHNFARTMLYGAEHPIRAVLAPTGPLSPACVVGPICETGDVLSRDAMLPPMRRGAAIALLNAGAYGYAQSTTYNGRALPREVIVDGPQVLLIRERILPGARIKEP